MNTPIYADLDQIVFEGRSRDYGAYEMRDRYNRVLTRAMLIGFMLFIAVTGLPKMVAWITPRTVDLSEPIPDLVMGPVVELPPRDEDPLEKVEVPEMPSAPAVDVRSIAVVIPVPTPDEQVREEAVIAEMSELDSAAVGLSYNEGNPGDDYNWSLIPPTGPGNGGETVLPEDPEVEPGSGTFVLLEKEPQAVNLGELKELIGYPPLAKEAEIQGKVVLRIMVDKNGDYVKHIVLKDPHPILTKAVTDKINHLKMTPGIQSGHPIKVWVTLPFDFTLLN
jgi:protein TonB